MGLLINLGGIGATMGRVGGVAAMAGGLTGNRKNLTEFYKSGGGQFGLYSATKKDAQRMLKDMTASGVDPEDILKVEGWGDAVRLIMQPLNAILSPKATLEGWGRAVETAPRLAEFKRLRGAGATVGEAALSARELSLDFSIHGTYKTVKLATKATPFLNPMLQGVDKLGRMAGDNEVWATAAATMVVPSVLLWQLNHSDPEIAVEYSSRPQWERNSYWLLPKKILNRLGMSDKAEGFFRLSKPFELGFMYGSVPENALDVLWEYDQIGAHLTLADAFGEVGDTMLNMSGSFMSPSLPMPIGPMIEASMGEHGYSVFTGRPIDPLPWMNIPQEEQKTPYTSWTAMAISQSPVVSDIFSFVGFDSAAKVDFAINGYGGTLGREANQLITELARNLGWQHPA